MIGATGLVTDSLVKHIKAIIHEDKHTNKVIGMMQHKALIGSMRVLKSALSMKAS